MSSPTLTSTTCQSQSPAVDYHLNFKSAYTLWHLERNNSAKLLMELTELHVKDATKLRPQSEQGRMMARSLAEAVADRLNDVLALNPYDETDRSMLIKLCDSDDEPWGDLQSESWDPMASIVRTEVDRLRALSHRTGLLAQVMTAGPGVETECYRQRRLILELAHSVLQQQKLLEDVVDGHNWSAKRSKYDHRADF